MIFLELFLTFFKIGAFTFGGGYAMLPLVSEAVVNKGWLAEEQISDFIAVSESTPGPFAINISTYVGSQMGSEYGIWGSFFGAFVSTLGTVLPSFIIILIIAKFFEKFKNSKTVGGCMKGLKPASIGLISSAVILLSNAAFFPNGFSLSVFTTVAFYVSAVIFVIMLIAALKKVSPIYIIIASAILGIGAGYLLDIPI